jgi:hypothetical protein
MYQKQDDGLINFVVLFKKTTPYVKIKEEQVFGYSFEEVYNILSDLKTTVLKTMKKNKLVTFNSMYDSMDGFYL